MEKSRKYEGGSGGYMCCVEAKAGGESGESKREKKSHAENSVNSLSVSVEFPPAGTLAQEREKSGEISFVGSPLPPQKKINFFSLDAVNRAERANMDLQSSPNHRRGIPHLQDEGLHVPPTQLGFEGPKSSSAG
ncbi:hypothetical protein PHSY_001192 [Pseudozyma hubeiensis SY62]|uniref:Uncharacterized protein n=1 Tax=Pseudozyma hubeiensis (strain SY62) TaxID=1305764 RepID=R9NYD1_PSEHS|nr:hypothetical protein PHSY_001192 [Pseudozyma hubeiensis SY62]GAC93627.1 hypothetical protein PHSY_001192 [Pseudozyma hubeiensis SY62]